MEKNFTLRIYPLLIFVSMLLLMGCGNEKPAPDMFKNTFTGELLDPAEFQNFRDSIYALNIDSLEKDVQITFHFKKHLIQQDSVIQPFNYSIRKGMEYIIRDQNFGKIGMKVPQRKFITLTGDSIQIGGTQDKPTLINLWFVGCKGCVAEIPVLNKISNEYAGKVNFVSMTFDGVNKVMKFLEQTEFNFSHIVDAEEFIEIIGSQPYPENIFVRTDGSVAYIEGGIIRDDSDYFKSILDKLLE